MDQWIQIIWQINIKSWNGLETRIDTQQSLRIQFIQLLKQKWKPIDLTLLLSKLKTVRYERYCFITITTYIYIHRLWQLDRESIMADWWRQSRFLQSKTDKGQRRQQQDAIISSTQCLHIHILLVLFNSSLQTTIVNTLSLQIRILSVLFQQ